jgi:integrase
MASIFKRRKGKHEPYTIQYSDHLGKRRTTIGFTDKGLTEQLAAKLESEARLRRTGMIDPEMERIAKTRSTPLGDLLSLFEQSLSDNSPKYVKLTMSQVRRVVDGVGFKSLGDLDAEAVQTFLRSLRTSEGIGHRTYNQYLQALGAFCNWCVTTKRLSGNPLVGIERLNTAVDVRHARRALTAEEVSKLIESARSSGVRIQGYSGEQRARIYLTSYLTGLRRNELGSLTRRSFDLDATPPTITVEAVSSKHRKKDVLPLHPELVGSLREWFRGMQPGEKLFPKLVARKTWRMVKKDLERVGIPYETEAGIADFHAAGRHTHITELLRKGASLPEAKELARHSDIKTTMRYTHIGLKDQARAVAGLKVPVLTTKNSDRERGALQGRCVSSGADSLSSSLLDIDDDPKKRQSPRKNEGRVIVCHREALGDLVGATGFEPATSWTPSKRASQSAPRPDCFGNTALRSVPLASRGSMT